MNKIIYQTIIDKHVDILSFDNIFLECNIAQAILFGSKKSGNIHNFKMDVDPRYIYIYIKKFRGGVQCYTMESKDIVSSICFKKNRKWKFSIIQRTKYCFQITNQSNLIFEYLVLYFSTYSNVNYYYTSTNKVFYF